MTSLATVGELLAYLADKPKDMSIQVEVETVDPGCGCCATGRIDVSYYPLTPEVVENVIRFV
jgi:hypothetical protein